MNIWIFCLSDDQQQEIALGWTELFGDLCFVLFLLHTFFLNLLFSLKMKICGLFFNFSIYSFPCSSFHPHPHPPLFFFGRNYGLIFHKSFQYPPNCIFDKLSIQNHCSILPSGNNSSPGFPERILLHTHSLEKSEHDTILPMPRGCWVLKNTTGQILYSMEIHTRNNFLKSVKQLYTSHVWKIIKNHCIYCSVTSEKNYHYPLKWIISPVVRHSHCIWICRISISFCIYCQKNPQIRIFVL